MNRKILHYLIICLLSCCPGALFAQHLKKDGTPDRRYKENRTSTSSLSSSYSTFPKYSKPTTTSSHRKRVTYSFIAARDEKGKIKRNHTARYEFMRSSGYPHGRPGYLVDHVVPLKKGGCDCVSNMQWQTKAAARAKDRWE